MNRTLHEALASEASKHDMPMQEDDDLEIELHGPTADVGEHKLDPEDNPAVRVRAIRKDDGSGVRIFIAQKVFTVVMRHAESDLTREQAGALFGNRYTSERGPFLEVREAIRAPDTVASRAHVTFTPKTWDEIEKERQVHCPGAQMVGWYHTHPNLGVFLSGADRFIHENFFNEEWMVALVYDPVGKSTGLWSLINGKLKPRGYCEMIPVAPANETA